MRVTTDERRHGGGARRGKFGRKFREWGERERERERERGRETHDDDRDCCIVCCTTDAPPKIDRTPACGGEFAITASFGRNYPSGGSGGTNNATKRRPRRCVRQWHSSFLASFSQSGACSSAAWLVIKLACVASVPPFYCSSDLSPQFRPQLPITHACARRSLERVPRPQRRSRSCYEFRHPSLFMATRVSVSHSIQSE